MKSRGVAAGRWLATALPAGLVISILGCSGDDSGGFRSFELEVQDFDPDRPLEAPDLPDSWAQVDVVIIEAPTKVTAGGDDFPVVLEMRNRLMEAITLDPCPVWEAGMGESGETSSVEGTLPCEEIGSLRAGERITLRMQMPPTEHATAGEGGEFVGFGWRLKGEYFQQTQASISFAMDGPK